MHTPIRQPAARQPTALFWSVSSLIGLGIAIAAAILLVRSPATISSGLSGSFYFIVLVVLGCSSALLLFGAMRGYAKYKGRVGPGTLEIGGPIVVACLTVYGGYMFRPLPSGNLVVRVVGPGGSSDVVCPQSVQIELGQDFRPGEIGQGACQAQFNEVPSKFLTAPGLVVRVKADGYEMADEKQYPISADGVITVAMRKVEDHSTAWGWLVITGTERPVVGAKIFIDGVQRGATDRSGQFQFDVPMKSGSTVKLTAIANNRVIYDDMVTLPIAATIGAKDTK
jgi:hypothetical protein